MKARSQTLALVLLMRPLLYSARQKRSKMKPLTTLTAVALTALLTTFAMADPPVPIYTSHITDKMPYNQNTFSLKTSDALNTVTAFYRTHLKDMTDEHKDDQGSIFYTKSGATVTVSPGSSFDPGTTIAYSWDIKKYGPVPVLRAKH